MIALAAAAVNIFLGTPADNKNATADNNATRPSAISRTGVRARIDIALTPSTRQLADAYDGPSVLVFT